MPFYDSGKKSHKKKAFPSTTRAKPKAVPKAKPKPKATPKPKAKPVRKVPVLTPKPKNSPTPKQSAMLETIRSHSAYWEQHRGLRHYYYMDRSGHRAITIPKATIDALEKKGLVRIDYGSPYRVHAK